MGTYQSKKIKKKRIRQVTTNRPIKILFLGRFSKLILHRVQEFKDSRVQAVLYKLLEPLIPGTLYIHHSHLGKDSADRDRMAGQEFPDTHSPLAFQLDLLNEEAILPCPHLNDIGPCP